MVRVLCQTVGTARVEKKVSILQKTTVVLEVCNLLRHRDEDLCVCTCNWGQGPSLEGLRGGIISLQVLGRVGSVLEVEDQVWPVCREWALLGLCTCGALMNWNSVKFKMPFLGWATTFQVLNSHAWLGTIYDSTENTSITADTGVGQNFVTLFLNFCTV